MIAKSFEQYIADWDASAISIHDEPSNRCSGCLGPNPVTIDGYCRECVHARWGYDQAEEHVVHVMIGGAVKAALEWGTSPELIAVAVQRAFGEFRDRQEESAVRLYTEVAEGRR